MHQRFSNATPRPAFIDQPAEPQSEQLIQHAVSQIIQQVNSRPVTGIANEGATVEEAESADSQSARSDRTRDSPDVVFQNLNLDTEHSRYDSDD